MGYDVFISYSHAGDDLLSATGAEGPDPVREAVVAAACAERVPGSHGAVSESGTLVVHHRGDGQHPVLLDAGVTRSRASRRGVSAKSSTGGPCTGSTGCCCC